MTVRIDDFLVVDGHAFYCVVLERRVVEEESVLRRGWVVHRRFSEFKTLHKSLKKLLKSPQMKNKLPALPPNHRLASVTRTHLELKFLKTRAKHLSSYLTNLISERNIRRLDCVQNFLHLAKALPEIYQTASSVPVEENQAGKPLAVDTKLAYQAPSSVSPCLSVDLLGVCEAGNVAPARSGLDMLKAFPNSRFLLVPIFGPARTGKSFLLNHLSKSRNSFKVYLP